VNQTVRFAKAANNKENPWPVRFVSGLAVLYLVSPLDIVPDMIPVLGFLDDFLIVFSVVMWVINRRKNTPAKP
jgi:uncharacterized membrane protein YkvA (DUF1232 family)